MIFPNYLSSDYFLNRSEDYLLTVEAVDRVLFEISATFDGKLVDFDEDFADLIPPYAQNSMLNWFENFSEENLEVEAQNVTFETYQGDLIYGKFSIFFIFLILLF